MHYELRYKQNLINVHKQAYSYRVMTYKYK